MNKKLLLKFSLFVVIGLAGITWGAQAKASALMCGVLAPAINVSSPPKDTDCLNGQSYTALTSLSSGSSSNTLKNQFITKMTSFESGQNLQQVGAAFIEDRIAGVSGMFWQDRLKLPDVTLDVLEFSYSKNSSYEPLSNSDVVYPNSGTVQALVFIVDGVVRFAIKLNCGNLLDDMTLPAPPIIRGYKVDETGNINGMYSLDIISATNSVPNNDINQPFNFSIEKNPSAASSTISPADTTAGWKVIGSTYVGCNTANIASQNCPLVSPSSASLKTTSPNYVVGSSRLMTGLKAGYIYDMSWVYQKVVPIKPVIITGYKLDTQGNKDGPYSSDWIRAYSSQDVVLSSDNRQPYNLSVQAGNITIKPDDAVGGGWSAILKSVYKTPNPGDTIRLDWVYTKAISPNICPASNVPNPPNVNVSLPDKTPVTAAPPAATKNPNYTYYQNTSMNTTKVTNVQDVSSGGNKLLSMLNLKSESYQQAVVDYMPFVLGYPYDNNQASVSYTSAYTVTPYISASTPSSYTCADGSTPDSSHICTSSITISSSSTSLVSAPATTTHCSNNTVGTWNGTNCGTYGVSNATYSCASGTPVYSTPPIITSCDTSYNTVAQNQWTCHSPGNTSANWSNGKTCLSANRTAHWACPGGGVYVGGTVCHVNSSIAPTIKYTTIQVAYPNPPAVTTYGSCVAPDTAVAGDPSKCTHTTTTTTTTFNYTPAIAWYNYTKQTSYTQTVLSTANGLSMTPCFSRGFSVSDVSAASANVSFNDNENPTSVNAGGYTASVKFFYTDRNPTQGLRQPMSAKLTYGYKLSPIACSNSNIPFTVTGGFAPSGPSLYSIPNAGAGCPVSVPPLSVGNTICATYSVSPTGSTVGPDGSVGSNGGTLNSGSQCSAPVVNKPYFKVFGSDISVGGGFYATVNGNKTCTSTNSSIFGWNTGTNSVYSNRYAGAGAQFLLSSTGSLKGAASNQNNPNASPWPAFTNGSPKSDPIGFSFSNIGTNSAANSYGTSLGAANCIPDYYSSLPTSPTPSSLGNNSSLSGNSSTYTMPGGSTIKSSNIGPRDRVTVYVNGDLYIDGDINFVGSYSTINDIPSLIVIVKDGNIYIKNTVANLSGIFIAQSTISNKGYIYDCALDSLPIANNQLFDICVTQLTVNGSFIANKVVLNRTGPANKKTTSSLRGAVTNETNTNTNATEIFNYGPAFWMNTALPITNSAGTNSAGYDSIINLPPVL